MKKEIILPKKIKNHQPKPTKAQLVEALVQRAKQLNDEENKARHAKREEIQAQIDITAQSLLARVKPEDYEVHPRPYNNNISLSVTIDMPPEINRLCKKLSQYNWVRFDEKETKKKILESLKNPNPLLGNSELAKALDQILEQVLKAPAAIEA